MEDPSGNHATHERSQTSCLRPSGECQAYGELVAELTEALEAFAGVYGQFPETLKLINPKLGGFEPITVTVTKAQFLAAHAVLTKARGGA